MALSVILTTRPLRNNEPVGSYQRDGKLYVSVKDNVCWRNGVSARLEPQERRVMTLCATPRLCGHEELVEMLYGDREDGGPDAALRTVWVRRSFVNKKMLALGVRMQTKWGQGSRLVEIEPTVEAAE